MEIRRSYDRLISTMGFPILVRQHPVVLWCGLLYVVQSCKWRTDTSRIAVNVFYSHMNGRYILMALVNSPHKWPVMQIMFSFDDVIMFINIWQPCAPNNTMASAIMCIHQKRIIKLWSGYTHITLLFTHTVTLHRWFSARLHYLQCVSNGDTAVLH